MDANNQKDLLKEHAYDGIQEYSNQLPTWWIWQFLLCVIFGVIYYFWYHAGGAGVGLDSNYEKVLENYRTERSLEESKEVPLTDDELYAMAKKPDVVAQGAQIFTVRCVSCHAADGGGLVGPNLTDDYWLHGNKPTQITKVVEEGVPAKGMIPWKGTLSRDEISQVVAYVISIHGNKVANPKAPQGDLIPQ